MAAGAHRHGVFVAFHPVAACAVAHGSRRKVGLSGHPSHEGERHVIAGHVGFFLRPATLLHAKHGLVVEHIGECPIQSGRRIKAVIVEEELIAGTMLGDALRHFHSRLVVAVEEVDLKAFHTHIGILATGLVEMLVEHIEHRPKHNANTLFLSVADESRQVDGSDRIHDITLRRVIPALVEHDVLQTELRSKVNVILICLGVDASLEADAAQVPVVPPVPSHLAGLDPSGGTNLIRRSQRVDKVVHRHLRILFAHGKDAPGIGAGTLRLGNIVLRLCHIRHAAPAIVVHLLGVGGERSLQFGKRYLVTLFLCYFDKHARILPEVAFEQRHLGSYAAVFLKGDGQEGGQVLCFGKRCLMVGVLESHGERLLLVGGVGEPRFRFATKVVFSNLVLDDGLTLAGG